MSALTDRAFSLVSLGTALGSGLVAGIFFAFSNFVMPAINRQPQSSAIATMQAINVVVLNRGFLAAFVGTALGCLVLAATLPWTSVIAGSCVLTAGALYRIVRQRAS